MNSTNPYRTISKLKYDFQMLGPGIPDDAFKKGVKCLLNEGWKILCSGVNEKGYHWAHLILEVE